MRTRINTRKIIEYAVILLFCALFLTLEWYKPSLINDKFINRMFLDSIQAGAGITLSVYVAKKLSIRLFMRPEGWVYLLPCLLVAINNFQFSPYFKGEMTLVRTEFWEVILFTLRVFSLATLEEIVFRGIVFTLFLTFLPKDRKGFLLAFVLSSVVFGVSHILNGFSLSVVLQIGYSILTGGLFCFCFIKTKNILLPSFVHGVFNFCGTLFDKQGLGAGVVFDTATVVLTLVIGVLVGCFVLYKTWTYTDEERAVMYDRLGVSK